MNMQQNEMNEKTKRITLIAMFFALAIVLSIIENIFPVPSPVPGVKLGLSNIVVMFSLFNLQKKDALTLAFLKSGFVMLTRGTVAGILSLSGGLSSLGIMCLLLILFQDSITYLVISILGAIFHNIGQITVASILLETMLWAYFPVLLVSGIITGFATSVILRSVSPMFLKLRLK